MGRLDEVTLEELYELKTEIDEGKPRERNDPQKIWVHSALVG